MVKEESNTAEEFPTGSTVPFPWEPYPQQIALMDVLLQSLKNLREREHCPVYMLESPTGTGKSLSLACAAVSWLRYMEQQDLQTFESNKEEEEATTGIDWLDQWTPQSTRDLQQDQEKVVEIAKEARMKLKQQLDELRLHAKREQQLRSAVISARKTIYKRPRSKPGKHSLSDTEPYCSDEEVEDNFLKNDDSDDTNAGPLKMSLAASLLYGPFLDGSSAIKNNANVDTVAKVVKGSGVRKIIYAARTHSQLTQFVNELRRTAWGSDLRVVALGGRKALCGNHKLNGKPEASLTEACLDLQKGSSSTASTDGNKRKSNTTCGCPLLSSRDAVDTLALHTLVQPTDIEEAGRLGLASETCAYYASRVALPAAEVVTVPYNLLLSSSVRAAVGLSLKQSLVVIDEAHNLPEALRGLHSCRLSLPVVQAANEQLQNYVQRYADRLAARNIQFLGQLRKIVQALEKHLKGENKKTKSDDKMRTVAELLFDWKLANINLFALLRYMERSRLSQKLLGFVSKRMEGEEASEAQELSKHVSAMSLVQAFIEKLTLPGDSGKIVTDWPTSRLGEPSFSRQSVQQRHAALRYVLLKPSYFFQDLLQEAHAVALVGGTMRPFAHLASELLGPDHPSIIRQAYQADNEMKHTNTVSQKFISSAFTAFSCDHVVPESNVLLQCWGNGPNGSHLDFRHFVRGNEAVIDELGEALIKIVGTVPNGVVVFVSSYQYEALLVSRWRKTHVWAMLERTKHLHREPKIQNQVDSTLLAFSRDAASTKGALLFSVMGGKLSEGINFSNEMARCVVVVGLPYPDLTDPVLKEKMTLMDSFHINSSGGGSPVITGQSYYQNLCLRAINQTVGRAIRHAKDFASIILLDTRYLTDKRIQDGLPRWLKRSPNAFDSKPIQKHVDDLRAFFLSMGAGEL